MAILRKNELMNQVFKGATEFEISAVLFRHAVSEIIGVNVTDMECLGLIFFKGLSTPSELAHHTGLTSGATTAMLDRLEKAHLIERRRNPNDRRGVVILQTNESRKEVGTMFVPLRKAIDNLTMSYSEDELELISNYFSKLTILWTEEREKLQLQNQAK